MSSFEQVHVCTSVHILLNVKDVFYNAHVW